MTALLTISTSSSSLRTRMSRLSTGYLKSSSRTWGCNSNFESGPRADSSVLVSAGLAASSKDFDFSPLQAHHIQRDLFERRDMFTMSAQPRFQP